jgi:hypothetical protein
MEIEHDSYSGAGIKSMFGKIKGKFGSLKDKVKGKVKGAKDAYMMRQATKRAQKMGLSASKFIGTDGKVKSGVKGQIANNLYIRIGGIILFAVFLGLYFGYIFKNDTQNGLSGTGRIGITVALVVVGIIATYFMTKGDTSLVVDFILSSEVNILCIYVMISYFGYTNLISTNNNSSASIVLNIIPPVVFVLLPLFLLLNNFLKNWKLGLLLVVITGASFLAIWPNDYVKNLPTPSMPSIPNPFG